MKECEAKLRRECKPRVAEALERLLQLYDASGKPDQADAWWKKLEETKPLPSSD